MHLFLENYENLNSKQKNREVKFYLSKISENKYLALFFIPALFFRIVLL